MVTERIRLGTMLTPLPWKQPWKLAGETAALDNLSGGRAILAVGLGAPDAGATAFDVPVDRKLRAELLDEGLDVVQGLWGGTPFTYHGKHYQVTPSNFPPPPHPVQRPRIPTWVVGIWPHRKSLARTLRCDGILPAVKGEEGGRQCTPEELKDVSAWIRDERGEGAFDIVVDGETADASDAAQVTAYQAAGATWWNETRWAVENDATGIGEVRRRIVQGPPRLG
jgi:alkanesulfonate monooxygenase SsuD/methylene tetrahydromethanopterin reductase-like flavin-dependent oxidoreductase (luciferase family)